MSNVVFPTLLGQEITASRAPFFSTKIQTAVSGKETRAAFMAYPKWNLSCSYEFLRDGGRGNDLQTIEGLFLQMRGAWDSFLVVVPSDSVATDMLFATGDGVTKTFQLTRMRGANGFGFAEPCQNIATLSNIKAATVTVPGANYSRDGTGRVTFVTAPADGAALTWTGTYYFRCRFSKDECELDRFLSDLWKLGKCEMVGAPGNRVL
jgi:hypothetical protein